MNQELEKIYQEKDRALRCRMIRELRNSGEGVDLRIEDWSDPRCNSLVASCVTDLEVRNVAHCTPLGDFPYYFRNLQYLDLENNSITDLRPLCNLSNLTRLDLKGNPVTDFSPLDTLVKNGLYLWEG